MSVLARHELEQSPLADLHALASELGIESFRKLRREELIDAIVEAQGGEPASDEEVEVSDAQLEAAEVEAAGEELDEELEAEEEEEEAAPEEEREEEEEEVRSGVLDILPNGSGFMRVEPFVHSRDDVYVSPAQIRRCELRAGDELSGPVRPPRRSERYPSLVRVDTVNGQPAEPPEERPRFEDLTPVFATKKLPAPERIAAAPFGRGSRVAISGPPGAGATMLLREIVAGLEKEEGLEVTVVLAGVRPEEVTEWRRATEATVAGGGFDRPAEELGQVAQMAVERAKRAVERGRDAVLVVDVLDALPPGIARRLFGAARATEEAGSLTVIASTATTSELQRLATTRILLEQDGSLAPGSGTTRISLLS